MTRRMESTLKSSLEAPDESAFVNLEDPVDDSGPTKGSDRRGTCDMEELHSCMLSSRRDEYRQGPR